MHLKTSWLFFLLSLTQCKSQQCRPEYNHTFIHILLIEIYRKYVSNTNTDYQRILCQHKFGHYLIINRDVHIIYIYTI